MSSTEPAPSQSSLADHAQTALDRGHVLLEWWMHRQAGEGVRRFELLPPEGTLAEMSGFYDVIESEARQTPVMGCLQKARFVLEPDSKASKKHLNEFIHGNYLELCRFTHADGMPGGFGYTPLRYKLRRNGQTGSFSTEDGRILLDLSEVGKRYEWVVMQVDIHDFVRSFPPLKEYARSLARVIRESAYVVAHQEFALTGSNISREILAESSFGYSFLPRAVEPNFFGFGPGRFWAAIKLFRFLLLKGGVLEIQLAFIVAPRSEKVLYLWGFDPIYSAVHAADLLTLRQFGVKRRAHDKFDAIMLRLHGQVHHNLLDGMRDHWVKNNWVIPAEAAPLS